MNNSNKIKNLKPIIDHFEKHGEELRFSIGQSICTENYLPGQIFLITKGSARLITNIDGNLKTIKKLLPGSLIGIASLLKGISCEEVRACEKLIALSLSDKEFKDLYKNNSKAKKCCDISLLDPELIFLVKRFFNYEKDNNVNLTHFTKTILRESKIITLNNYDFESDIFNENILFSSSLCGGSDEEFEIRNKSELESFLKKDNDFLPRVIAIQKRFLDKNLHTSAKLKINLKSPRKEIPLGPTNPSRSSFNQFDENPKILARGNGPVYSTMACFEILSNILDFSLRRDAIEKGLKEFLKENQSISLQFCGRIAAYHGFQINISKVDLKLINRLKTPALIPWKENFAVLLSCNQDAIKIATPSEGFINIQSSEFKEIFKDGIEFLIVEKSNLTPNKLFGVSWFLPSIKQYKGVLIQILIAGFIVQLFTLANPLLIQVIIDKVISQRSLDTLQVLGFALLLVTLLEGLLSGLKTFLLSETTNRIDQSLAAQVIDHLLGLPLKFFERRPTGELSSRIDELEKIRNFLTGQAFTTILDAAFSVIYIFVMVIYSLSLTLISLSVLPIQIGLTLLGAPLFRKQFRNVAEANADSQSHLVETLNGIETVKAQNVELNTRWKWQKLYSRYINRSFEKTLTGTTLVELSQVLQKISQLFVLWVGASFVLKGQITLGQLIAFRIISGYVTQPLLRLSTIWQNIQELKVSFERLADVIDTPKELNEIEKNKIQMPMINGAVTFEKVDFIFNKGTEPALKSINLSLEAKKFIGIVGQSGSGKSTLMKLLPRLYSPDKGKILVDGYDIKKVELDSLRRQIGIVPQEPLLFSGTISENIALSNTEIRQEEIINAAKIADAHDFIMELPNGYSTEVRERGSSLSGGQRQRITIARTLITKPSLLILDEATSSLDYESEKRVCNNLLKNLSNCTVFFITHRLPTVKNADIIIMMHKGMVEEIGTHKNLMDNKGRYFALYKQQDE